MNRSSAIKSVFAECSTYVGYVVILGVLPILTNFSIVSWFSPSVNEYGIENGIVAGGIVYSIEVGIVALIYVLKLRYESKIKQK